MSALPSPLKSLEPAMLHAVGTVPKLTVDVRVVPFMSQITRWPVELFCQRMSGLPSPLKSLEPAMLHDVATNPKLTAEVRAVQFMTQIRRWPGELFCQRMSALLSALKSLFTGNATILKTLPLP